MKKLKTGVPELDIPLEGGLPFGKMTAVHGWIKSGRTALLCHLGALAARQGIPERSIYVVDIDPGWAADKVLPRGVSVECTSRYSSDILGQVLVNVVQAHQVVLFDNAFHILHNRFAHRGDALEQTASVLQGMARKAREHEHLLVVSHRGLERDKTAMPEARHYGLVPVSSYRGEGLVLGAGVCSVKESVLLRVLSPLAFSDWRSRQGG